MTDITNTAGILKKIKERIDYHKKEGDRLKSTRGLGRISSLHIMERIFHSETFDLIHSMLEENERLKKLTEDLEAELYVALSSDEDLESGDCDQPVNPYSDYCL